MLGWAAGSQLAIAPDVVAGDVGAVLGAQQVLGEHLEAVGELLGAGHRVEAVDLVAVVPDLQGVACPERVQGRICAAHINSRLGEPVNADHCRAGRILTVRCAVPTERTGGLPRQSSLVLIGACCHRRGTSARYGLGRDNPARARPTSRWRSAVLSGSPSPRRWTPAWTRCRPTSPADGVAAPAADVAGLQKVVAGARDRGVDLKVVVMEKSPPIDTPLRDIATQIGQAHPDSTVLVLSPGGRALTAPPTTGCCWKPARTSPSLTPNPVQGAQNFVDQLNTPDFPVDGIHDRSR